MKKKLSVIIAIILAMACLIAFTGCNGTPSDAPTAAPDTTPTIEPTIEPTNEPTNNPTSDPAEPTPTPKPLDIPARTVETKEPDLFTLPEADENGKVLLNAAIESTTPRTVGFFAPDPYKAYMMFLTDRENTVSILEKEMPITVIFSTMAPSRITDYTFVTSLKNDPEGNNRPTSWKLYAANLSTYEDEVLIDERSGVELPNVDGGEMNFEIASPEYYTFYKLVVTESVGNEIGYELDDIRLYGEAGNCIKDYVKADSSLEGYTILNGALNERMFVCFPDPQAADVKLIFDCDIETSEFVCGQYTQDFEYIEFIFAFKQNVQIDAYRFTLAISQEIPTNWEIYADTKSNFENEVLIDDRKNMNMLNYDYAETEVYKIQNPGAYKYYKIKVYSTMYGNDEGWMCPGWREITLLQKN